MSSTGTYVLSDGKLKKVSDKIPGVAGSVSDMCTFKEPYVEEHLGHKPMFIRSRKEKAQILKKLGCVEKSAVHGGINVERRGTKKYY